MNWFVWLGVAVVITAVAAVIGVQPKGARPVANTRMMAVARVALLALAALFAYFAFRSSSG